MILSWFSYGRNYRVMNYCLALSTIRWRLNSLIHFNRIHTICNHCGHEYSQCIYTFLFCFVLKMSFLSVFLSFRFLRTGSPLASSKKICIFHSHCYTKRHKVWATHARTHNYSKVSFWCYSRDNKRKFHKQEQLHSFNTWFRMCKTCYVAYKTVAAICMPNETWINIVTANDEAIFVSESAKIKSERAKEIKRVNWERNVARNGVKIWQSMVKWRGKRSKQNPNIQWRKFSSHTLMPMCTHILP